MKVSRILFTVGLALVILVSLVWALSWQRPLPVRAEAVAESHTSAPAAPLASTPFLGSGSVADAPFDHTPTIDGMISPGEYAHAGKIAFAGYGGDVDVFFSEDGNYLYVAFDFPDPQTAGSAAQIFLDTNRDGGTAPQSDDYRLSIRRSGTTFENCGTGSDWGTSGTPVDWTAATTTTVSGWQAEFRITYAKLGITHGTFKALGLSLINAWTPGGDYYWPTGGFWNNPSTWGALISSSYWGAFYWKPWPWEDYAPSGLPDFDQKQACWGIGSGGCSSLLWPPQPGKWTYCGPAAAANSLWWFDSKFEPSPAPPSVGANDHYYLVTAYEGVAADDHDPPNVGGFAPAGNPGLPGLVDDLAWYFDTDGQRSGVKLAGTEVHTMSYGLQWYLYGDTPTQTWGIPPSRISPPYGYRTASYYDDHHVQLVKQPTWQWTVDEVWRSEDVILLLGFWQEQDEQWVRLGGHYVTVAGIDPSGDSIAFSDPFWDNAELGGKGQVLTGTLLPHKPVPHPGAPQTHNDAGNVSHDVYAVSHISLSPSGLWEIEDYVYPYGDLDGLNCPEEFKNSQGMYHPGPPVMVEVEYALAVSPFTWKPGGEWVDTWWNGEWLSEWWWYKDDGNSCVPDFSLALEQDWHAYDAPTALANSLWWFDSKAETLIYGDLHVVPPPAISDHYGLVTAYGPWDDHAVSNTVPFIEDLGRNYLDTGIEGTTPAGVTLGIHAYLSATGTADDFYTLTQDEPTWEWIADEVETCEDVLLLLGFYEETEPGIWARKGGHWVGVAGVNRAGEFVGLSDPAIDNANAPSISDTLHLGRVFPPEHLGTAFGTEEKKDPQAISHDIYHVTGSGAPAGQLALDAYPISSVITDFVGLNGGGAPIVNSAHPITTVVEWAIGVSPYSELVITKTGAVTHAVAGGPVTYTLEYANWGLAAVEHVIITDALELASMTAISYTASPPLSAAQGIPYEWTLPRLSYGQSGIITVTGQSLVTGTLRNTVTITGVTAIDNSTPDRNPDNNAATWPPYAIYLPLVLRAF